MLLGCASRGNIKQATIFVTGDSAFRWNHLSNRSAADVLEAEIGRPVYSAARTGDLMTKAPQCVLPGWCVSAQATSIPQRYIAGNWQWVVVNGGINDLWKRCECGDCQETLNQIEQSLTDFVLRRVEEGHRVMIWSYYSLPSGPFGADACNLALQQLSERQRALARTSDKIFWVDGTQALDPSNHQHYFLDKVHPSVLGSRRIGEQLARAILAAETAPKQ